MASALESRASAVKAEIGHHHGHQHDHARSMTVIDNVGTAIPAILKEKAEMIALIDDMRAKVANTAPALKLVIDNSCLPCVDKCDHDNMVTITNKAPDKSQVAKFIAPDVLSTQITDMVASDDFNALSDELKAEYGPVFIAIKGHLDNIARFQSSIAEKCACCCAEAGGTVGTGTTASDFQRAREGANEQTYDAALDALDKCGDCPHKGACEKLLEALYDIAYQDRISR